MELLFKQEVIGSTAKLVLEITEDMELDMFSLNMINRNEIAYVAPVELVQYDKVNYLQFNVTGKNTLSRRLSEVLNRNEVMRMFSNIINAFEEMDAYMLPESGALLDYEYVYVDEQDRCMFLYIPFKSAKPVDRILFLQGLTELVRPDYSDRSPYLFNILNSFSRGAIKQIGDFKEILRKNSMETAPEAREKPEVKMPSIVKEQPKIEMPSAVKEQSKVQVVPVVKEQPNRQDSAPAVMEQGEEKQKPTGISFAIPGKAGNVSMNIPQSDKKAVNREEKKEDKKKETKRKEEKKPVKLFGKKEKGSDIEVTKNPVAPVMQDSGQSRAGEDMYESYEKTVMMPQSTASEVKVHIEAVPVVELVRKRNGENLRIMKESVILGSGSETDCRIDGNKAISRKHAFLFVRDNTYYIMDNNSSNGTWVNRSRLTPGVEMEISSGDLIRIANEDFEFQLHV